LGGLASGPRAHARCGAGHGSARERCERGAEGAGARLKKESGVKAPKGGPCLSGHDVHTEVRCRACWAGRHGCGPRTGSGPGREGEEGETGWLLGAGPRVGRKERELGWVVGWVWAGLVWVLGWVLFYFLSPFFSKLHPHLFEFKLNFEFKPYPLNQIKFMHQHECTNIFILEKF